MVSVAGVLALPWLGRVLESRSGFVPNESLFMHCGRRTTSTAPSRQIARLHTATRRSILRAARTIPPADLDRLDVEGVLADAEPFRDRDPCRA